MLRGLVGGGAALVVTKAGGGLAAPAGKADICHLGDDGLFHLISVSGNALPAHAAHGDGTLYLGTLDHCSTCGDVCDAADPCTTAACTGGACNGTSACTGYQTCGGGGIAGECGCTPTFTEKDCDGITCGDNLPNGCGDYVTCGCADGYVCGENGCEAIVTRCTDVWLAGYPENSTPGGVCTDDFLDIYVNDQFVTTVVVGGCKPPVPLGALQNGDTIYVELHDNLPPCTVEPFRLICGDTGAALQDLNAAGHCSGTACGNGTNGWAGNGICYYETFTVNF